MYFNNHNITGDMPVKANRCLYSIDTVTLLSVGVENFGYAEVEKRRETLQYIIQISKENTLQEVSLGIQFTLLSGRTQGIS